MGRGLKIVISNEKMVIYRGHHQKAYRLEEGEVYDGYLLREEPIRERIEQYYKRYGSRRQPITFVIHSTTVFRWICTLPMGSHQEVGKMLKNHEKELLPIEAEHYHLMYRILGGGGDKSEQQIGVVGIPEKLKAGYTLLGKKLKVKQVAIIPKPDEVVGRIKGLQKEGGIVIYGVDGQLYGLMVNQQFCSMTQQLLRDVSYHETEEMCFLNRMLQLIHFQREEGESLPCIYSDPGEETISLLQRMGIQSIGDYFQERLYTEVHTMPQQTGTVLTLEGMGYKPFIKSKSYRRKQRDSEQFFQYAISSIFVLSMVVWGSGFAQEGYYRYHLKKLEDMMAHPDYVSYFQQAEKRAQLAEREEGIEHLIQSNLERNERMIQHLQKLEEVGEPLKHLVKGYCINGTTGQVSISGYTPTPYGIISTIEVLEQTFGNYEVDYQLESENLMTPGAFEMYLTERGEMESEAGQVYP